MHVPDAAHVDAAHSDAGPTTIDGGVDAGSIDSGSDAGLIDAGLIDSGLDSGPRDSGSIDAATAHDAGLDAGAPDGGATCTIGSGETPALDGVGDVSDYSAAQVLTPGATLAATDVVAIAWDDTFFYVTVTSEAFLSDYLPLHVYLEATSTLAAATPGTGKEYGGLTANLPFTATHLIAVRHRSDSGAGDGAYDGVYTPTAGWTTMPVELVSGSDTWISSDNRTISARVPWSVLGGCPTHLRLVAHVVNQALDNEWKDLVPEAHTPWLAGGGGYYEIDLTGSPAISGWTLR